MDIAWRLRTFAKQLFQMKARHRCLLIDIAVGNNAMKGEGVNRIERRGLKSSS
jgi:hypothetical protein